MDKIQKKPEKKVYKVPEPEPIHRCCYCGKTNYVLPRAKSLIKAGCKYCADCGGLMILYDFSATKELRSGIADLLRLQWNISEQGLGILGGSIKEVEVNLFQKLNAATVAFGNFKEDSLFRMEKRETLLEHKDRVKKNRECYLKSEIRKSIPKELKKGKTRYQINKMVEQIKKDSQKQTPTVAGANVIFIENYKKGAVHAAN